MDHCLTLSIKERSYTARTWAGTPKCTRNNYSQSETAVPAGYSLGSYLGQVGADEPAAVTTLGVELIESQSEHQLIKNRSGTHGIEVCIKRKEHFFVLILPTLLTLQH